MIVDKNNRVLHPQINLSFLYQYIKYETSYPPPLFLVLIKNTDKRQKVFSLAERLFSIFYLNT